MDKIIKASVSIAVLLVAASVSYYFVFALPRIQKQRLAAELKRTMVEQDRECGKSAKQFFDNSDWSSSKNTISVGYENHFNPHLNRCYIFVRATTSQNASIFLYRLLADVDDGKTIAQYDKQVPSGVAEYQVKPFVCSMLDKYCQTDDEFDAFVKTYMGP